MQLSSSPSPMNVHVHTHDSIEEKQQALLFDSVI